MKKIIFFLAIWGLCFAEGLERGERLYKSGLFQSALDVLKDEPGEYPTYIRAECLFQLKEYERAHKEFLLASKMRQPEERQVLISFRIPECLWLSGRKEEAIGEYENAVKKYPNNSQVADVLYRIGLYCTKIAPLKAMDAFTQLLKGYPNCENIDNIHYLLGLLFEKGGDKEATAAHFKEVLDGSKRMDLRIPPFLWMIDWVYNKGEFDQALILTDRFARDYPEEKDKIKPIFFSSLYKTKRYDEAIALFPEIEEPSQEQFFAQGEALYETERYQEAVEAYKNAGTGSSAVDRKSVV